MGTLWQPHPTQDQPTSPGGFGIDSRICAAATKAPAASREDYCPQAILKFKPRNSFDYRVRYEPQLSLPLYLLLVASYAELPSEKSDQF